MTSKSRKRVGRIPTILIAAGLVSCVSHYSHAASVAIRGENGAGYFAVAGLNPEPGPLPIDDPTSAKFMDYPYYTSPENSALVVLLSVEPYRFGLEFPDPLHPLGPGSFASVSVNQAFTADADFGQFDLGAIEYDSTGLTRIGTETIAPSQLTLQLDGTDFRSLNRDPSFQNGLGADPSGRSNNNEFFNDVTLAATNLSGTGFTFTEGYLTSIDFSADVTVAVDYAASQLIGPDFTVVGTLTFTGNSFAFDVDSQASNFFATDIRFILNRAGSFELPTLGDADGDTDVDGADFLAWQRGFQQLNPDLSGGDFDQDNDVDQIDLVIWKSRFGTNFEQQSALIAVPEPSAISLVMILSITFELSYRKRAI